MARYEIKMLLDSDQGIEEFMSYAHKTLFELDLDPISFHIADVGEDDEEPEQAEPIWLEEPVTKPDTPPSKGGIIPQPYVRTVKAPEGLGLYANTAALLEALKQQGDRYHADNAS